MTKNVEDKPKAKPKAKTPNAERNLARQQDVLDAMAAADAAVVAAVKGMTVK
jgi:enoyl-CoA hydratase/carnithine racemase